VSLAMQPAKSAPKRYGKTHRKKAGAFLLESSVLLIIGKFGA
jgi:hypothetical protein